MKKNIGLADSALRGLAGGIVLGLGISGVSLIINPLVTALVGALITAVAAMGICPLYSILKISTCRKNDACCGGCSHH